MQVQVSYVFFTSVNPGIPLTWETKSKTTVSRLHIACYRDPNSDSCLRHLHKRLQREPTFKPYADDNVPNTIHVI